MLEPTKLSNILNGSNHVNPSYVNNNNNSNNIIYGELVILGQVNTVIFDYLLKIII